MFDSRILRFRCGAIAQLGERLHGMQEVRGSIPRSSTNNGFLPTGTSESVSLLKVAALNLRVHGLLVIENIQLLIKTFAFAQARFELR